MPLTGDPSKDIPELIRAGHPQKQAEAIALKEQRERNDADAAGKGYKKFPSYSLAELKKFAAEGVTPMRDVAKLEMIKQEIRDRESGESKQLKVPQVGWGKKDDVDEITLQDRLDTMTQQVNSIGQVAAKVAGRMDNSVLEQRYKQLKAEATKLEKELPNAREIGLAAYEKVRKEFDNKFNRIIKEMREIEDKLNS